MKKIIFVCALVCLFLTGCNTTADLTRGQGVSFVVEGKTYDQVWRAVYRFSNYQLKLSEVDRRSGTIKGKKLSTMWSQGELVGVFVSPSPKKAGAFIIEVQSEKLLVTNVFATDWTATFVNGIQLELEDTR